jgi:hypothetical protein
MIGVKKRLVMRAGKNIIFRRGGINFVFGPKYKPPVSQPELSKRKGRRLINAVYHYQKAYDE